MEKYYFVEKKEELPRFTLTVEEVMKIAEGKKRYDNLWALLADNQVKPVDKVWFYNDGKLFKVQVWGYDLIPVEELLFKNDDGMEYICR
jgi:hypothetical protein